MEVGRYTERGDPDYLSFCPVFFDDTDPDEDWYRPGHEPLIKVDHIDDLAKWSEEGVSELQGELGHATQTVQNNV